jgi:hypothetical protein
MSPRTIIEISAAIALGAAALADLIRTSDEQVVPVNVHTVAGLVSTFASDAAAFADAVANVPAGSVDQALTDRVTHIELLLSEAGLSPTAPAAAPAAPAAVDPAPAPAAAPTPAPAV